MMMTCDEVRMSLGAYVLGALEPDECVLVEAHLAECAGCQAEFEELTGVAAFLGRVSEEDVAQVSSPPQVVLDRLLSAKAKRRRMTRVLLSLAASVLVIGLGGTVWMANRTTENVTAASAPESATAQNDGAAQNDSGYAPQRKALPSASAAPESDAQILLDTPGDQKIVKKAENGPVRATVTASAGEGATVVKVMLSGVAKGTPCRLNVIGADGLRETAGNWIVDKAAYDKSGAFTGTTTIPPSNITRFEIVTATGRLLLSIPVP
ncbi:anti-sigma factor family protein [Streptosporangium sp. NPDC000396]|uniref:anti-sigma factor family protein n=1 Tax=Streptosporangium sp. NPDC000396 TaxID=3366185 RepID=UPI00369C5755